MEAVSPVQPHILALDDDPAIRALIADYLAQNELRVTTVASGKEFMEVLARETVDLVVLDLRLPGEDGLQIARKLREESLIPILILTGRIDEADRVMGLELGADDYLTKPFSPRELLARIRALLRRARAQATVADEIAKVRAYRFGGWELSVGLRKLKSAQGAAAHSDPRPVARPVAAAQRRSLRSLDRRADSAVAPQDRSRPGATPAHQDRARGRILF